MSRVSGAAEFADWSADHPWVIGSSLLLVAVCGVAAVWLLQHDGYRMAAFFFSVASFVIATVCVVRGWRIDLQMRRDFAEMQQRYQDMFDRAGISIWQEDWSAVGEAIQTLRAQGVEDIVAWYRDRPDEARALHARVRVTHVNWHGCQLMCAQHPSELIGALPDVVPGSFASFPRWLAAFCSGDRVYVGENRVRKVDGEILECFVTAAIPADLEGYRQIMVSMLEITEYKRDSQKLVEAREELARAQRIITASTLAATIAHEINSPLAAVATNTAACLRWLEKEPPVLHEARDAAQSALSAIERAQAVVSHTKLYFTRAKSQQVRTDLCKLISDTIVLIESEASRHDVELLVQLDSDMELHCDPIQVQQALVNLCINAIQAMSTSASKRFLLVRAFHEDQLIAIAVMDTGPGIRDELQQQIFDPFYSTKEGGMGMGLAISRSCVEAHGGWIKVNSKPGQGTEFKLMLPLNT